MEIRQGIKAYSDWPTIPQLYVKGEFVGGSDIMMEMFEAGELEQLMPMRRSSARAETTSGSSMSGAGASLRRFLIVGSPLSSRRF